MLTTAPPPQLFDLTGTLIGYFGGDPHKPKSILLEVEQEQMAIRVPKELRSSLRLYLKPGDRLRCIGRSSIDFKSGVIELKAYQLLPLSSESDPPAQALPVIPAVRKSQSKKAKILVCHKSGCQKRGGRQMVAALEQMLLEYQLHDRVEVQYTGCQKRCSKAPNLTVMPGKHHYDNLSLKSLSSLIEEHFCDPASSSVSPHVER